MRQLTTFLILLAGSLAAVAPAQACTFSRDSIVDIFWSQPPDALAPGEVAIEVVLERNTFDGCSLIPVYSVRRTLLGNAFDHTLFLVRLPTGSLEPVGSPLILVGSLARTADEAAVRIGIPDADREMPVFLPRPQTVRHVLDDLTTIVPLPPVPLPQ